MNRFRLLLASLLSLLLCACGDDETPWPAYRQELAELLTGADGKVAFMVRDTGDTLRVSPSVDWQVPDTVVRAQVLYCETDGRKAVLQALSPVVSPFPEQISEAQMRTEPVGVEALSRGGRYLNFYIYVKTSGGAHRFAFRDCGVERQADGSRLLRLQLYHDSNADGQNYRRQVCLSCPLYGYADRLFGGRDSVEVLVSTFDGSLKRRFPY